MGEDFSTKYTLEIEKGEGEDKCGLGVNGAKNHLFPLQKASEKERTCTFNQPLWLNGTYFWLTQISGGQREGQKGVCLLMINLSPVVLNQVTLLNLREASMELK